MRFNSVPVPGSTGTVSANALLYVPHFKKQSDRSVLHHDKELRSLRKKLGVAVAGRARGLSSEAPRPSASSAASSNDLPRSMSICALLRILSASRRREFKL